ncbi:hypothetical protein OSB04_020233 [Centaurea solstitialis]|uniref:Integrase catalytic domain-containing protein n=1 Tax=Centaurea solstitialis TaxID=347529 RepID=A0AA38T402_9ASTR|nr:hypothetical protein OSB04_020233 [Centaurea solstitialis]
MANDKDDASGSKPSSFHPALTVSNIRNFIPITLEIENVQYASWAELFKIHARAFQVLDHIIPPRDKDVDDTLWKRLDAIVLQWIYGTISTDLLHTILEPDASAERAWTHLQDIFQDNKSSRALANVGSPVSNQRLVLQLVSGLSEAYDGVATIIQQSDPLPPFYKARSMLTLEETRKAQQSTHATAPAAALYTSTPHPFADGKAAQQPPMSSPITHYDNNIDNRSNNRGRGRGRGRGRSRGGRGSYSSRNYQGYRWQNNQPQWSPMPPWYPSQWAIPPCPYPTTGPNPSWAPRPDGYTARPSSTAGILGPRPPQAYHMNQAPTVPTNIDQALHTLALNPPDDDWYMDTGATSHMTSDQGTLSRIFNSSLSSHITVGDGSPLPVTASGMTHLPSPYSSLSLKNVLVVPDLVKNLISVRQFTIDNNVSVEFDPCGFSVKDLKTGANLMRSNSHGNLYPLSLSPRQQAALYTTSSPSIWHLRLGHPGRTILSKLVSHHLISKLGSISSCICQSCQFGKHNKLPFYPSTSCSIAPFDLIHSDIWTSPVTSSCGYQYYLLFLDDFTNFVWVFPLAKKSHTFQIFMQFRAYIRTQFEKEIKGFQCDNGREYDNTSFRNLCAAHGIHLRFSCPYTSSQNGKAERKLQTLNKMARTLLFHAHVPPAFWPHSIQMAAYLHNILPNKRLSFYSPTQILYRKLPAYHHIRVFGCLCYPHTPSQTINKLQPRSVPCVFLGFPSNHRGYKCYDTLNRKILISRHVTFDESSFPFSQTISSPSRYTFLDSPIHPLVLNQLYHPDTRVSVSSPISTSTQPPPHSNSHSQSPVPPSLPIQDHPPTSTQTHRLAAMPTDTQTHAPHASHPMMTRSKLGISKPNQRYALLHTSPSISPLPTSHVSALKDTNWRLAMQDEYDALIKNATWELVPRPKDVNVIRCMWIFNHKFNSNGTLERHKARLVVNGRSQQVGVDCHETFSPVVKPATIRTVLTLALSKQWGIHQLDVKNAFLHGTLQETVFMHQPPGFKDMHRPDHVCRLRKSLYGLKQAPRAWYHRFATFVAKLGFSHSKSDNSLFVYRHGHDVAYLLLYVDDIILTASSDTLRRRIISRLGSEFAMKDLGPLSYFLGISVKQHQNGLFLSQSTYAKQILARANMSACNPTTTPVDPTSKLSATSGPPVKDPTLYRSLAGALQYLTFTRPDISYAVQQVCLFMHDPRESHLQALRRILRYIQGTIQFGLHLSSSPSLNLQAYTDADWGGCPDTRRSTSGYCVFLGDNLISWSSKRQPTLSRSSAEAEYRGVANVVAETCWLRNLLLELCCPLTKATMVYCDNVSAIYLSGNPVQHQRTKHIEMDIHFVREHVAKGQVRVMHVPSRFQFADIFTKGLPRVLFEDFRSSLNIRHPPVSTAGG